MVMVVRIEDWEESLAVHQATHQGVQGGNHVVGEGNTPCNLVACGAGGVGEGKVYDDMLHDVAGNDPVHPKMLMVAHHESMDHQEDDQNGQEEVVSCVHEVEEFCVHRVVASCDQEMSFVHKVEFCDHEAEVFFVHDVEVFYDHEVVFCGHETEVSCGHEVEVSCGQEVEVSCGQEEKICHDHGVKDVVPCLSLSETLQVSHKYHQTPLLGKGCYLL